MNLRIPTSVDLNVSQVNNPTVQTPVQDFTTPSFDTPSMPDASVNMNDSIISQVSNHIHLIKKRL